MGATENCANTCRDYATTTELSSAAATTELSSRRRRRKSTVEDNDKWEFSKSNPHSVYNTCLKIKSNSDKGSNQRKRACSQKGATENCAKTCKDYATTTELSSAAATTELSSRR